MRVNFVDLRKQYAPIIDEIFDGMKILMKRGSFVGGDILKAFEEDFANYIGVRYCVGVGSGTDALILALRALDIGPGDEVIVPANTFIATAFAVSHVGATPVFVDVSMNHYTIDYDSVLEAITDRTKAIIPVHLYGFPAYVPSRRLFIEEDLYGYDIVDFFNSKGIYVIEDCAQSIGATYGISYVHDHKEDIEILEKVGNHGNVSCFSFYPAKNLGGLGQGGAITTNDEAIANKVRSLGNIGRKEGSHYEFDCIGYNSRLDTLNAHFLWKCLPNIDEWNNLRVNNEHIYFKNLSKCIDIKLPSKIYYLGYPKSNPKAIFKHVFHLYEIKCETKEIRDNLKRFLEENDIGVGLHYPIPCHKQPPYVNMHYNLPVSEELADTLLSLPMHPYLTEEEIIYVCDKIKEFFGVK